MAREHMTFDRAARSSVRRTMRPAWLAGAGRSLEMKRILVAYDGGEPGHKALDTAVELAKATGAMVSVVSVVPVHAGRAPFDPWDDRVVHAQELQEARAILDEAGISAEYLEPAGDPARTIEGLAADNGFDVIVVGSRGLGAVSRFLQGSVSEHVATHAKATVVIAR
jgi:nucleotide-binding universal stress UspA family protein